MNYKFSTVEKLWDRCKYCIYCESNACNISIKKNIYSYEISNELKFDKTQNYLKVNINNYHNITINTKTNRVLKCTICKNSHLSINEYDIIKNLPSKFSIKIESKCKNCNIYSLKTKDIFPRTSKRFCLYVESFKINKDNNSYYVNHYFNSSCFYQKLKWYNNNLKSSTGNINLKVLTYKNIDQIINKINTLINFK